MKNILKLTTICFLINLFFSITILGQPLNELMDLYAEEGQHNAIGSPFNGAVLIAKGDNVLLKKAYGFYDHQKKTPLNLDSKFLIGSVTKQFTSMLIMQQVEKGVISLEKNVSLCSLDHQHGLSLHDSQSIHQ